MSCVFQTENSVRLRTLLALDNVELDVIALFQRLVSVQLDRGVMDEYIRPIFAADESIALCVIEPLDLPFVLSHNSLLSCTVRVVLGEQR